MGDLFRFAEPGKTDRAFAALARQPRVGDFHDRQVDAGSAVAEFKNQSFFMIQAAIAGDGCDTGGKSLARRRGTALIVHAHDRTSFSAEASAVKSSSVLVSVAAKISKFSTDLLCGSRREAGTPAITPLAANASTTGAAGLGSLTVESLKKAFVTNSTPRQTAPVAATAPCLARLIRASPGDPSPPTT